MPGSIWFESFRTDNGERCNIIEFESLEDVRAWRDHPEYVSAQQLGRETFYAELSIHVTVQVRASRFTARDTEGETTVDID